MMSPPGGLRRLSARTSLRVKLIAVLLALVALALVIISVASVVIMRKNLMVQTDAQLKGMVHTGGRGPGVVGRAARACNGDPLGPSPSPDFLTELRVGGLVCATTPVPRNEPAVPTSQAAVKQLNGRPFTATSASGVRWRVIAINTTGISPSGSQVAGVAVIAKSLDSDDRTLGKLAGVEIVVGSIILVLFAGIGILIVGASMRPLVTIEETAEAIAAGDLARRVPDADRRTEVGRLGNALNGMLAQIEKAFRAQSESEADARHSEERMRRFIADASHELRTPLSVIRGFAEYYRQRQDVNRTELDRLIGRVEDEATRMGVLVEDLLMLARLDQQRPLAERPVDVLALAADAVQDGRVLAPERDISLSVRSGSAFIVIGDDVRLRQVIGNLMGNALRYTPADTPIVVIVRSGRLNGGPGVVLEVEDHGPGLPPEQAERVFERFYRADPARTRADGGTGLGLAIVAGLVAAHGGTVELETAPGLGATFRVTLPLEPDAMAVDELDGGDAEIVDEYLES
jgi:two-component system, OmpR family, sensor kinase